MSEAGAGGTPRPTATYAEFTALDPWHASLRALARDVALRALAVGRRIDDTSDWIRFPYYHHVFDDERTAFARQLDYLAGFGEFISIDDAVALLESGGAIDGRYFCISFDDGLKSCLTGALPILAERGIAAAFYVVTAMIGATLAPDDAAARRDFGFRGRRTSLEFLTWDDCRTMARKGMIIGSHCRAHVRLADLGAGTAMAELSESKAAIEREVGAECGHFCPPYGIPEKDFFLERDGTLARETGYRSLATGWRGAMRQGDDPFRLRRDHLIAGWGKHQLRYFLSLP